MIAIVVSDLFLCAAAFYGSRAGVAVGCVAVFVSVFCFL